MMNEVTSIDSARNASIAGSSTTASSTADGDSFSAALAEARKRPKGEQSHEYLNRTGNARDGEAFSIVQRGGRTFHVYGTGEDREVFELQHGSTPTGSGSPTGGLPAA
jgi:hypothetical protein